MIMMSQDFEMSPRTKASNASIRRGKIEKMRMDNSATTIQALWRGAIKRRAYKKRLLRNGSRQPKHKICDSGVAPIELKNIRPEPILSKTMISSARSTLASSSSRKLVESQRDDDDDGCLERDDMDDEEALAVSAAEHFEERLIRLASLRNLVPTWPDALSDDFDDPEWPDLETASSTLGEQKTVHHIEFFSPSLLCFCLSWHSNQFTSASSIHRKSQKHETFCRWKRQYKKYSYSCCNLEPVCEETTTCCCVPAEAFPPQQVRECYFFEVITVV